MGLQAFLTYRKLSCPECASCIRFNIRKRLQVYIPEDVSQFCRNIAFPVFVIHRLSFLMGIKQVFDIVLCVELLVLLIHTDEPLVMKLFNIIVTVPAILPVNQ